VLGLFVLLVPGAIRRWLVRRAPRGRLARLRARLAARARSAAHLGAGILAFPVEFVRGRCVEPGPGDLLLLADASWAVPGVAGFVAHARARGARVGAIVYDLIPIEHPAVCTPTTRAFAAWISGVAARADLVVTISEVTRRALEAYLSQSGRPAGSVRLGTFRLGTELDLAAPGGAVRPALAAALHPGHPLYLVVGTVEPRKNHLLVLDALEERWARGSDARLLVAGRCGWQSRYAVERMRLHPELGRRLFFFEDLSDSELSCAYDAAAAVICASFAEGFGLPVVEALSRGVPVFASDIDPHREVGGKHVVCFDRRSPAALAAALEAFETSGRLPDGVQPPETFHWPDWRESTVELLDELLRLSRAPQRPLEPPGP
jgi:alpha-1,2-rhamnosyltransferase